MGRSACPADVPAAAQLHAPSPPPQESDGEGSSDDEGYHDAPAVLAGGEPPLPPEERPCCLRCQQSMAYVGQVESDW